jgi:Phosphotransferase enzyme family
VVVHGRLDRSALSEWCLRRLDSEPDRVLFEAGYLSQVVGLRLATGSEVVVKVRAWQERLIGCGQVQHSLSVGGFPAPRLLVGPERLRQLGVSAEALVHGGQLLPARRDSAVRFAEALARLVRTAPAPSSVGTLAPSPAWVGWDHAAEKLWPAPDDRDGDLNEHAEDRWLDETAAAAREQLRALDRPAVVGHGDWYSQNLRWINGRLHVVHDWDSVVAQPEAAIAGQAAAVWPGTGLPGEVATMRQSEDFLAAYERASGQSWTDQDVRAAWAAGLWTRAFDAKKASLVGADPAAALTKTEANERRQLAGAMKD